MTSASEDRAREFLESSVEDFKIFIDTCSILDHSADKFWMNIIPILKRKGKALIVPYRVYQEVDKFARGNSNSVRRDPTLQQRAVKARNTIIHLQGEGLVEIYGDQSDNFADNVFLTVFTQKRMSYNLMLITQDRNLGSDILNIKQNKSINSGNRILVESINHDGYLSILNTTPAGKVQNTAASHPAVRPANHAAGSKIPDAERFAFATNVTKLEGSSPVSYIPKESDEVIARRNGDSTRLILGRQGPSGGEGTIYDINIPGYVAKIYKKEKIDRARHEKLNLMLTRQIDCEGVCFPIAVLYNTRSEFVGYLMKKASGRELQKCVL